jgi:pimeloyl-ACP methyl ester carboxylesterase
MREDGQGDKLEAMIDRLEAICNIKLPPGKTPGLSFMAHLWHPLRHVWRPATTYLFCDILALGNHWILRAWGFRRVVRRGSAYYVRGKFPRWHAKGDHLGHAAADEEGFLEPVLFLHGVGAGSGPYLPFIAKTIEYSGRPMVVPIFKHVSMRVTFRLPTVEDMVDDIVDVMRWLNAPVAASRAQPRVVSLTAASGQTATRPASAFSQAAAAAQPADALPPQAAAHVIAHSYGSLVASRLCQASPSSVASLMLVDPVCFAMYMPTLLRSFLYRLPSSGAPIMDMLMWVVARELHCVAAFCRGFFWSDYNLWPEYIPDRALVALSGHDILTPNPEVRSWLEEETAARVVYCDGMRHAGFVLRPSYQDYLLQHWRVISTGRHRPDVSEMLRREANGENAAGELYVRQIAYAGGAAARGAMGHPGYVPTDAWTARIASELEVKDGKARYYRKATAAAALGQAAFSLAMARRRHEQAQAQQTAQASSSLSPAALLAGAGPSVALDVTAAYTAAAKANNGVHHKRSAARAFLAHAAAGGQGLLRQLVASGSGALGGGHHYHQPPLALTHSQARAAAAAAAAAPEGGVVSQALPPVPAPLRSQGSRSTGGGAAAAAAAAAAARAFAASQQQQQQQQQASKQSGGPPLQRPLSASSGGARKRGFGARAMAGLGLGLGFGGGGGGNSAHHPHHHHGAAGAASARSGSLVGGGAPDLSDPRWASALAEVTKAAEARKLHIRNAGRASGSGSDDGAGGGGRKSGSTGGNNATGGVSEGGAERQHAERQRIAHTAVAPLLPPGAAYILYRDPESEPPLATAQSVDAGLVAQARAKAKAAAAAKAREQQQQQQQQSPEAAAAAAAAAQRLLVQQMSVGATSLLAPQMSIAEERSSDLAEDASGDDAEAAARREEEALAVALEAAAASLRQQQRARRRAVGVRQARRAAAASASARKASDGGGLSAGGCAAEERRASNAGNDAVAVAVVAGAAAPPAVVTVPS